MSIPNGGLITETNRQYYEGAQSFLTDGINGTFNTSFNTDLIFGSWDPSSELYALNNFKLYSSPTGLPGTYTEVITGYNIIGNTIEFSTIPEEGLNLVIQLNRQSGGNYGNPLDPNTMAYGNTVEENYGGYAYITLDDIVTNFMIAYVGNGKLISSIKKTDVIFHVKRAMQEFSYDTLRSMKSQELTVPNNLSVPIPQDYVNYVKFSWVDRHGVKHPIYPTTLTSNPSSSPIQDTEGIEIQDNLNQNIEGTPIIEERWRKNNYNRENINLIDYYVNGDNYNVIGNSLAYGRRYGLDPQYSNFNGTYTINNREGKISFSSDLVDRIIIFEYISDGLAYDMDTKIPKLAEDAMYAYVLHAIISTRSGQPEYLVQRLKQEKSAKLRNAKIRLSNIKLEEITQVFRGQSKWIKH